MAEVAPLPAALPLPDIANVAHAYAMQAEASTILSQNAALLPNIPAVNQANILQQILASVNAIDGRLNAINGRLTTIEGQLNIVRADVETVRGNVETVRADVQQVRQDLRYESECTIIRSHNTQQARNGPLIPLPHRPGCPAYQAGDFPANELALPTLPVAAANHLLAAYGLPTAGNIQ